MKIEDILFVTFTQWCTVKSVLCNGPVGSHHWSIMRNIHSHAVNVEKSCPLDRKCQHSTQKTSVGDSVSSNLYNVGAGETSRSFSFLIFSFIFLICNFSLRLDRISASALYYLDIHKPYTLCRTIYPHCNTRGKFKIFFIHFCKY